MLFNSIPFIIFIIAFLPIYFRLKGEKRLLICLAGSYFFYGWWDWRFIFLILLSTCFNFFAGLKIEKEKNKAKRKNILVLSIIFNIGMLGLFKYYNFFRESLIDVLNVLNFYPSFPTLNIILPIGISFYTFQTMSYVIDLYLNKTDVEKSLLRFATFVALFPQLVAGPIVRAGKLLPQLRYDQPFSWADIIDGMELVLFGYFLKVVVADSLAPLVDEMINIKARTTSLSLMVAITFFSFQIYCDFNGYSKIAIGIGKIMGFDFGLNFNRPYLATSFSEFWQRWHISMSSWLRDYLYVPLGGNRQGNLKTACNLFLTMLLGGLWHGANWTFVVWGGLHGVYLVLQRIFSPVSAYFSRKIAGYDYLKQLLLVFIVFIMTTFAWIFFRAPDINIAMDIIIKIFQFEDLKFIDLSWKFLIVKGVMLISVVYLFDIINYDIFIKKQPKAVRCIFAMFILWSIPLLGTFKGNSFIYFQF